MIRLIIADDHPAVIAGIEHELSGQPDVSVVGSARSTSGLIDVISSTPCEVLVTDFAMPGEGGVDGLIFISYLRRHFPDLRVIVFTVFDNPAIVTDLIKLGVRSIVNKADDMQHLTIAIRAVYAGATYYSPLAQPQPSATGRSTQPLTTRESEVVRLFVVGYSVSEIAERLHRSKQTISTQKSRAMAKLGVRHDAELVQYARESGLVTASDTVAKA